MVYFLYFTVAVKPHPKPHTMSREVTKIVPESNALQRRFPDGDIIDLSIIGGWDEIEVDQQRYFMEYVEHFPKKVQPAMKCGINTTKMYNWWGNDPKFQSVAQTIHDLYTESLRHINFEDSIENSKVRVQELKALGSEGYERKDKKGDQIKNQQNNFIVDGDKKGLAGIVDALDKAKEVETKDE